MISFITSNEGKFKEVEAILSGIDIERLDVDLPEVQSIDAREIVQSKLEAAFAHSSGQFIVEDTSLYLDCFKGSLPGPLVKWFTKTQGLEGLVEITEKLGESRAVAQTIFGFAESPEKVLFFEGSVSGTIVRPRGEGFGWDSIFQITGSNQTFGEMPKEVKNTISHRFIAASKLKDYIETKK